MTAVLKQTPKQIVEDAMLAAMITKRIPEDFCMSEPALKMLYQTVEGFIAREDEEGLYHVVSSFLVGYAQGWRDSAHPNKNVTKYSDYQSE